MKTVCKKLFSLLLVAVLLVSVVPFQAFAATGDSVKVYFRIDNEPKSFTNDVAVIGEGLYDLMPSDDDVIEEYNGLYSDGKVFTGKWVLAEGNKIGTRIDYDTVLSDDMTNSKGSIVLRAVFEYPDVTVKLKPNGGTVSVTSVTYQMHEAIGSKLPAPTRDGYVFGGWYTDLDDESTKVTSATVVTEKMTLYAKWNDGSLPVVFQGWDAGAGDWREVARRNPTTGKSLRDSGMGLPAQDATYGIPRAGYTVDEDHPWVDSNGNVFTADTVINAVTYVRPNFKAKEYTITYNYNSKDLSNETQKVTYGSELSLKKPTHNDYVFMGWVYVPDNNKEVKDGDTYLWTSDITLTAVWAKKGTVELRVYRDDSDGFKTYYYHGAVLNGELNLNNCKIQDYLKGSYEFDGWFDKINFDRYLAAVRLNDHESARNNISRLSSIKTTNEESSVTIIYGMVKGYKSNTNTGSTGNNTNTNTNTGTPDPSNPQTGDAIMIAVTTMALAAVGLISMVELKKRKMI